TADLEPPDRSLPRLMEAARRVPAASVEEPTLDAMVKKVVPSEDGQRAVLQLVLAVVDDDAEAFLDLDGAEGLLWAEPSHRQTKPVRPDSEPAPKTISRSEVEVELGRGGFLGLLHDAEWMQEEPP